MDCILLQSASRLSVHHHHPFLAVCPFTLASFGTDKVKVSVRLGHSWQSVMLLET